MKNKRLLVAALTGVMCFSMAVPAFGTAEYEKRVDNMEVAKEVAFEKVDVKSAKLVSANVDGLSQYEVMTHEGSLDVYTEFDSLSTKQVDKYMNKASYAIEQELAIGKEKGEKIPDIIEYSYIDGDSQITYLEGQTEDGTYEKGMFITEATTEQEFNGAVGNDVMDIQSEKNTIAPRTAGNMTDGLGIRAIASQDGSYMTGSFAGCPPLNVDKTVNGVANTKYGYYHYFGFETKNGVSTSTFTDMGVCYSPAKKGWLPYMKINQGTKVYMISSEASNVTVVGHKLNELGANAAYGMTSPVTISAYKSIDGYNGGGKTIRLTTRGTSISTLQQNVMCIAEAGTGVSGATEWRALSTIAGSENIPAASNSSAPRMEMNFTGVQIGTQNATWSSTLEDRSTTVSKGSGAIRGKLNF